MTEQPGKSYGRGPLSHLLDGEAPDQTIRETLIEAQEHFMEATKIMSDASRARAVAFRTANEAGVSLREIAEVVGITFQAVGQAIATRAPRRRGRLDEPWPKAGQG